LDELGRELEQIRRRKDEPEREIANLTNAVAQGDFSPALRTALVASERETGEIGVKLIESGPTLIGSNFSTFADLPFLTCETFARSSIRTPLKRGRSSLSTSRKSRLLRTENTTLLRGRGILWGPACTTRQIEFQVSLAR